MKINRINNLLLGLIILVNAYIIVAPVLPAVIFHFEDHSGRRQQLQEAIKPKADGSKKSNPRPVAAQPNHVVIPSMLLNQPILEGIVANQYKTLDKGIWRWPRGSTPDKGGNTILIGHRFTYTNPRGVFYYLNKVSLGDEIGVFWNNKEYLYRVSSINVVPPNDTSIENSTVTPELTVFTCTPLWLPTNRLVIVANLETNS